MSKLITPSLMSSISWLRSCPDSWKEKARQDLLRQVARDYIGPRSPSLDLGIRFENAIYQSASKPEDKTKGSELFRKIVEECRGGQFQKKVRKVVIIDEEEFLIYGKIDVWFPEIIKDIKTTSSYAGSSRYLDSFQHKAYCFATRQNKFRYIVAEFDEDSETIVDVYFIDYKVEDLQKLKEEVIQEIKSAVDFLKQDVVLWELYVSKFCLY